MLIKAISDAIISVKQYKKVHAETLKMEQELTKLKERAKEERHFQEVKAKLEADREAAKEYDKRILSWAKSCQEYCKKIES